jgi:hypothetical protein
MNLRNSDITLSSTGINIISELATWSEQDESGEPEVLRIDKDPQGPPRIKRCLNRSRSVLSRDGTWMGQAGPLAIGIHMGKRCRCDLRLKNSTTVLTNVITNNFLQISFSLPKRARYKIVIIFQGTPRTWKYILFTGHSPGWNPIYIYTGSENHIFSLAPNLNFFSHLSLSIAICTVL